MKFRPCLKTPFTHTSSSPLVRSILLFVSIFGCQTAPETKDPEGDTSTGFTSTSDDEVEDGDVQADTAEPDDSSQEEDDDVSDDEDTDIDGDTDDEVEETELPAIHLPGPHTVVRDVDSFEAAEDCILNYTRHEPAGIEPLGESFIFHGLMRGEDQFSDLANHLASWGITSTTVSLCHSTFDDVDTVQNARDAIALARNLGSENIVWMGQSNGGVSALIAGGIAPDLTEGVLGLDPVESFAGGASDWADEVRSPAAALFGISDSCNSNNSGRAPFASVTGSISMRISEADHCSFEFPTGLLCQIACQRPKTNFTDAQIGRTILELSTAWSLKILDTDFDGSPWWETTGSRYETLLADGAISPL